MQIGEDWKTWRYTGRKKGLRLAVCSRCLRWGLGGRLLCFQALCLLLLLFIVLDLRAFLQLCWFRLLLLRSFGCEHVKASGNSQHDLQIKRSTFSNKVSYFVGSVLLVGCWWFCIRFPIPLSLFKTQMAFLSFIQVSLWQFVECTLRACFFSWLLTFFQASFRWKKGFLFGWCKMG